MNTLVTLLLVPAGQSDSHLNIRQLECPGKMYTVLTNASGWAPYHIKYNSHWSTHTTVYMYYRHLRPKQLLVTSLLRWHCRACAPWYFIARIDIYTESWWCILSRRKKQIFTTTTSKLFDSLVEFDTFNVVGCMMSELHWYSLGSHSLATFWHSPQPEQERILTALICLYLDYIYIYVRINRQYAYVTWSTCRLSFSNTSCVGRICWYAIW